MAFRADQRVCWIDSSSTKAKDWKLSFGGVDKVRGEELLVKLDSGKDLWLLGAFVWPDTPEVRSFLLAGVQQKIRHENEDRQRINQTLQFRNQLIRDGKL